MKWSLLAVVIGFVMDLYLGDPHGFPHPVIYIGKLIAYLERRLRRVFPGTPEGEREAGAVLWLIVVAVSTAVPAAVLGICHMISPLLRLIAESVMCWQILAIKSLRDESMKVYWELKASDVMKGVASDALRGPAGGTASDVTESPASDATESPASDVTESPTSDATPNLAAARRAVSMIVGRDTKNLDAPAITRAAVETVAENTSDGVVAPLFYLLIGGAPLGFAYKAINTMDSMIGYVDPPYTDIGFAAAKADDIANFLPARIAALLMLAAGGILGFDAQNGWKIFKRDRLKHASPNSAQTESACAGLLRIRLAGDAWYHGVLHKKEYIGDALREIEYEDIRRACRLLYGTSFLALALGVAVKLLVLH